MTVVGELVAALVGLVAAAASLLAARTFRLRYWKFAVYYIASAMLLFAVSQLLIAFRIVEDAVLLSILELGMILTLMLGIKELKKTARKVGA